MAVGANLHTKRRLESRRGALKSARHAEQEEAMACTAACVKVEAYELRVTGQKEAMSTRRIMRNLFWRCV